MIRASSSIIPQPIQYHIESPGPVIRKTIHDLPQADQERIKNYKPPASRKSADTSTTAPNGWERSERKRQRR